MASSIAPSFASGSGGRLLEVACGPVAVGSCRGSGMASWDWFGGAAEASGLAVPPKSVLMPSSDTSPNLWSGALGALAVACAELVAGGAGFEASALDLLASSVAARSI